ncbi:MAG: hypothetical protein ACFFDH_16080 [Promethearchaeota archaeon]
MSVKFGRKHGNGYLDNVTQKITIKYSDKLLSLWDYEQEQLEKYGNIIYEREYYASWIERSCPNCLLTHMVKGDDGIYKCEKCGIMKVPLDHEKSIYTQEEVEHTLDHEIHDHVEESLSIRKSIRVPISLLEKWNPDEIRSYIESENYGSYDAMCDHTMKEKTKTKTIWLTDTQSKKWNSKKIKGFLYAKSSHTDHTQLKKEEKEGHTIGRTLYDKDSESLLLQELHVLKAEIDLLKQMILQGQLDMNVLPKTIYEGLWLLCNSEQSKWRNKSKSMINTLHTILEYFQIDLKKNPFEKQRS